MGVEMVNAPSSRVPTSDENNAATGGNDAPLSPPSALATLAGVAGNVLEWYDFAVFGFFSNIIGDVFFPPQSGNSNLIESFAVFGGAFFMRPGKQVKLMFGFTIYC